MLMIGAAALLVVRFLEKDIDAWGSIDYYIGVVCAGTILLAVFSLFRNR